MKNNIKTFICLLLMVQATNGQVTDILWQQTIGGTSTDQFKQIRETPDGGYIISGYSNSAISGDKTEASLAGGDVGFDLWIIKLDADGNIEWQNTINANRDDYASDVVVCNDGGYLIAAYSTSGSGADKSENLIGGGTLYPDFWIVKLNNAGAILWENTIGGNENDFLKIAKETPDCGFILGGTSSSTISGDKSEISFGSSDYWIVKTDASGNVEWDKTIGGTLNDDLTSLDISLDGGYILGGSSSSPISGNKTQNTIGNSEIYPDYWIVKTDGLGNVEWDRTYGGKRSDYFAAIQTCSDGGFIAGGKSDSRSFGVKSEDNMTGPFKYDYWVLKLNDEGIVLWENTIGGADADHLTCLDQAMDGGFYFGGYSNSGASFDKSEPLNGFNDYWIIKSDANGNILWENSINGSGSDFLYSLQETSDGGIILSGTSTSSISGDKTENLIGEGPDYWIIKMNAEICIMPSGLFAENITPEKTKLHCNIVTGIDHYQFWYREVGAVPWMKKNSATNFKTVNGLLPATTYEYKIRIECADGSFGEFSAIENFTTAPLRNMEQQVNANEILIYPNPASGFVNITGMNQSPSENVNRLQINIYDLGGKLIKTFESEIIDGQFNQKVVLNEIASGIYLIKCIADNVYFEQKLVIEY